MTSEYAKTFYLGTQLMTPEKVRGHALLCSLLPCIQSLRGSAPCTPASNAVRAALGLSLGAGCVPSSGTIQLRLSPANCAPPHTTAGARHLGDLRLVPPHRRAGGRPQRQPHHARGELAVCDLMINMFERASASCVPRAMRRACCSAGLSSRAGAITYHC